MNNEQTLKMTELDYLTASPHLQMIKAALPYVHVPEQKFFSVLVKISELERTIRLFNDKEEGAVGICSLEEDEPASPLDMLNAMKPYGTQAEQDFIDLIVNFLQGSRLYQTYKDTMDPSARDSDNQDSAPQAQTAEHTRDTLGEAPFAGGEGKKQADSRHLPFEQIKNMLPPEQQSRLETAQMLMQTFRQMA